MATIRFQFLRAGLLVCTMACAALSVQAKGSVEVGVTVGGPVLSVGYRGGHHGHYRGYYRGYYRGDYGGGWGWGPLLWAPWVYPQVVTVVQAAPVVVEPPAPPVQPGRPDPVIYPRNGQSAQQTEADRQECNRWATTQPQALADSSVFMRAADACMDGRGYTTK
jgi:hypothetical protein